MAKTPELLLTFIDYLKGSEQKVRTDRDLQLPQDLPAVGDDFNWQVRDYDSFRTMMLEALIARFPERKRWVAADIEVVLIELLSAELDKLSDTLDRVTAESYLETARRPDSLRRLLYFIGYDAVAQAQREGQIVKQATAVDDHAALQQFWYDNPSVMEKVRHEAPWKTYQQQRIVTLSDYETYLIKHPLVVQAKATTGWNGAWPEVGVALQLENKFCLDESADYSGFLKQNIEEFHREQEFADVDLAPSTAASPSPSPRSLLMLYVDRYRMSGQEVTLEDIHFVPIMMDLAIHVADYYFAPQVKKEIQTALSTQVGSFFAPGRLAVGETLFVGDLFARLQQIEGVDLVTINTFKPQGKASVIQASSEKIVVSHLEVIICDNNADYPERGSYILTVTGGRQL
ncbi:MAG: hypothetical protein JKY13_02335 [Gammaproteobacteria bacterium]|nr:hypothetical protein [Gammaproteobacteria bacterium]